MAVTAIIQDADLDLLEKYLAEAAGPDKDFFANDFTVIDVGNLPPDRVIADWPALVSLFKAYRLNPVSVRYAPPTMEEAILASGLGLDIIARQPKIPAPVAPTIVAPPIPAQPTPPTAPDPMIIDTPVRSGQRIYAHNSDLIVTAIVNAGAEIIADGNIHVYAPLRGRALAGASGNAAARIFASSMEAELVSIAGIYSMFETAPTTAMKGRPTQVRLVGNTLDIRVIGADS